MSFASTIPARAGARPVGRRQRSLDTGSAGVHDAHIPAAMRTHALDTTGRTVTDNAPLAAHPDRPEGSAVVELRGIKKSYGSKEVLHGVDLTVHAGEHVVIFGPSGSGKSTLLRTINLLEEPSEGSVRVSGVEYGPGLGAQREARWAAPASPTRRHGVPAVQPLPPPHRPRQHRPSAALGEEDLGARSPSWPLRAGCSRSASSTGRRTIPPSSPEARRSASRSPGR